MAKEKLHRLIHSLSPNEKKLFHQYAHRHILDDDPRYLKLFQIISKHNEYDEEEIKKELRWPVKDKNFHKLKGYLFELVMKSLAIRNEETSVYGAVLRTMGSIEILVEKQLFAEAEAYLVKAEQIAEVNEMIELEFAFCRWRDMLMLGSQVIDDNPIAIEKNFKKRKRLLHRMDLLTELRRIYYQYTYLCRHGAFTDEEKDQVMALFEHPMLQDNILPEGTTELRLFYVLKLIECRYKGQHVTALDYSQKIFDIISKYSQNYYHNEHMLIYSHYSLIQTLMENDDIDAAASLLESMKRIKPNSQQNLYQHFHFTFIAELLFLKKCERLSGALLLINHYEKNLSLFHKGILRNYECQSCITIINFFVSEKMFDKALKFIMLMINDKQIEQDTAPFYLCTRLLLIAIHFDLRSFDIMDTLIRNFEYFCRRRNFPFKFMNAMITFFKKLLRHPEAGSQLFREVGCELEKLMEQPIERIHLYYFIESRWLQIHGVNFERGWIRPLTL